MINVEPFKAKLVGDPESRETKSGPVCNMRVRQIDPGKPSVFIDVAAFGEEPYQLCRDLTKGAIVIVTGGLIYNQWESKPKGKAKPQKRSKHSVIAESVTVAAAE
ncbi:MAG TPA: single-stranded DNA-binding protein [Solirubrobacterales bacterium]|nr:single-stranded DNA-binding protein [Solirubrobacterales bacterium]